MTTATAKPSAPELAPLTDVIKYFGFESPGAFRKEWAHLTADDKTQIRAGLANGSLTY